MIAIRSALDSAAKIMSVNWSSSTDDLSNQVSLPLHPTPFPKVHLDPSSFATTLGTAGWL